MSSFWQHGLLFTLLSLVTSFARDVQAQDQAKAFHKFVSRPDIQAPRWRVHVYDKSLVSPGYFFTSPYVVLGQTEPGAHYVGPHIYDGDGELVWSGASMFGNWNIYDFKMNHVNGEDLMSLIYPRNGTATIVDDTLRVRHAIPIGQVDVSLNMHDFTFVDNGTRAVSLNKEMGVATRRMSQDVGYDPGNCTGIFHGFVEFSAQTWAPVYNWNSYNRIRLNESTFPQSCKNYWDYLHSNSIDKFPDGDYLMSARHTDAIYKISHKDGSIIWRLGGKLSDFEGDLEFSRQHDARIRGYNETHTVITFLDNAKGNDPRRPTNDRSRGLTVVLRTDVKPMTVEIVAHYNHPGGPGSYNDGRGNFQLLPNGHVFMCWSGASLQTEHTHDGRMIMQASFVPEWIRTYRSYKFPFVGRPAQPPDVHSEAFSSSDNSTTTTLVHVSWNGATEVARWGLFKSDETGTVTELVATIPRLGFETALSYRGYASFVVAEAYDRDGNLLGSSAVIRTLVSSQLADNAVVEETLWLQNATARQVEAPVDDDETWSVIANPIFAFAVGFGLSLVMLLLFWLLISQCWARGWRYLSSYEPLAEDDVAEKAVAVQSSRGAQIQFHDG